jgi:hypothetical protein
MSKTLFLCNAPKVRMRPEKDFSLSDTSANALAALGHRPMGF